MGVKLKKLKTHFYIKLTFFATAAFSLRHPLALGWTQLHFDLRTVLEIVRCGIPLFVTNTRVAVTLYENVPNCFGVFAGRAVMQGRSSLLREKKKESFSFFKSPPSNAWFSAPARKGSQQWIDTLRSSVTNCVSRRTTILIDGYPAITIIKLPLPNSCIELSRAIGENRWFTIYDCRVSRDNSKA